MPCERTAVSPQKRTTMIRTYSELLEIPTFEERYRYLRLRGTVGNPTFGFERYLNQRFYTSHEWRTLRHRIIARDEARDLGMEDFEIHDRVYIHHMNPVTRVDLRKDASEILDPEFLICVSHNTHNAIHYGDESLLPKPFVERRPGDTTLWRRD